MHKISVSIAIVCISAGLVLAQKTTVVPSGSVQQPAVSASAVKRPAYKWVTGRIDSVTQADSVIGTKSELFLAGGKGKKVPVLVKATTTLYDRTGKSITLDKIVKGDEAKVKFITTVEGVHEAASVKVMK